ncbi:FliC/FljB family flagellin [Halomonas halmophila]|uniref:Flagellin n=1 Tax=Halomonas halmophila TaxID=252 RepID=A0A4Y4F0T1_9GAMM|nr:FliC/FljB family flagellin [Halomonas halmophila]GED22873.1 flagellin [Halomonas halmophila]
MSVINTNITAMIAQQNLGESKNALATSMERLSSGLRINSAQDDAAGQAIANRMSSQITGLSQAQRNANDGISAAQTAEGGLNQVNDNLQRVRELTVQAQNGTNSQADLNSIQDEISQRLEEIDRISRETDFNGTSVLAEGADSMTIQVGAKDGQTIDINFKTTNVEELGLTGFNVNGVEGTAAQATAGDDGSGNEVAVTTGTATAADGGTLSGTYTLHQDAEGKYFANDGSDNFAVSNVSIDEATDPTAPTADFTVDEAGGPVGTVTDGPLASLDAALGEVDSLRSDLGAIQNRFESAITNLQTNETNLSAARSRIEDADYATEVADMTKNQILQQAGTSVLAQANQLPQSALSLLG